MWYFEYPNLDFDVKNYFHEMLTTCSAQTGPKIKRSQNFLKFGIFDISNMPISILLSKINFIKYLQPVRPKLVSKLKMLSIYWNLTHLIFWISQCWFWWQKLFLMKYLPIARPKLVPKWKMLRFYWNLINIEIWKNFLIKIIFDIKIEIDIFEISNVPNFNKFEVFSILERIQAEQVVGI